MKYYSSIFLSLGFTFLLFSSCEKVIDVDLDESDKKVVIEAQLKEGTNLFEVKISKTTPYFKPTNAEYIDDAMVTIYQDETPTVLTSTGNGNYQSIYTATANKSYRLEVDIDGIIYKATSFLPTKVELTDIYTEFQEAQGFFQEGNIIYFKYLDPAGESNFYRILHYKNGIAQRNSNDLLITNDRINDGGEVRAQLFQKVFESGDSVSIELIHFDEKSYDYFASLSDIVAGNSGPNGGSAAPGNPNTNFNNDALGYFSAYNSDTISLTIP